MRDLLNKALDESLRLNKKLRSEREKALGELTFFQFTKYQAFHKYLDQLDDADISTITTRKATLRKIDHCRYILEMIKKNDRLILNNRIRIETEKVA